jgi:MtrB/PioB family decaheme-associated outer membrane protein
MDKRLLPILVASLLAASPAAVAQQGLKYTGSVGFGGIYSNVTSRNPAEFYEYRDMESGFLSEIDVRGRGDRYYLDFFAENLNRTDQFIELKGGRYNQFKYQVYGDWLQHNLSMRPDGATSPYGGIGTSTLTAVFPNLNPASWNPSFDFETKRQNIGGMVEFSNIYVSPWYVRADANQVRTTGITIASAAAGTSPGNGFVDLPAPVDYVTNNWSVEGGYATKQGNFGVNFTRSTFTNDNQILRWSNPFFGGTGAVAGRNQLDDTFLPPDNDLWKIGANGALRMLPWGSTLAGRVTYSELTSDAGVLGNMLGGTAGAAARPGTLPSNTSYDGKIKNTTVALTLASNPMRGLDSRAYYNYYDKDNQSSQITFNNCGVSTGAPATFTTCQTQLFGYTRNNAGIDVGYRFNPANRLTGVIDYNHTDQQQVTGGVRHDYPTTRQWNYSLEWRNNSYEFLGVRLGAAYLQRRSDFELGNAGTDANDVAFLQRFVARYDLSDLNQTRLKLVLDSSPIAFLDFGFEGYWKWNDYKANPDWSPLIGREKDTRQEYYASVAYGDPNAFRVTLFGDIEFIQYDSLHRNINAGACPAASNCANPNTAPNATSYNWNAENNDRNWALGIGTDWKAMEKLTVKGSAIWSRTQGWADIVSQNNFGNPFPIRSYDTTSKVTLNLKGVYQYSRNWEFTGGYAYETYNYSDDQYNGYQYVIPAGTTPTFSGSSYLSGYYAFQNYSANIVYAMAKYKF